MARALRATGYNLAGLTHLCMSCSGLVFSSVRFINAYYMLVSQDKYMSFGLKEPGYYKLECYMTLGRPSDAKESIFCFLLEVGSIILIMSSRFPSKIYCEIKNCLVQCH